MSWIACFLMRLFWPFSLRTDNLRCLPGGWRWSRSGNVPKAAPIAKRPTPCAVASIGKTSAAWSSRIRGVMPRSSVHFAAA
jgi:hypothetical protein